MNKNYLLLICLGLKLFEAIPIDTNIRNAFELPNKYERDGVTF